MAIPLPERLWPSMTVRVRHRPFVSEAAAESLPDPSRPPLESRYVFYAIRYLTAGGRMSKFHAVAAAERGSDSYSTECGMEFVGQRAVVSPGFREAAVRVERVLGAQSVWLFEFSDHLGVQVLGTRPPIPFCEMCLHEVKKARMEDP